MKSINNTLRLKNLQSSMTRIILFGLFVLKTVAASKDNDSPANSGNSGRYTVKEEVQKGMDLLATNPKAEESSEDAGDSEGNETGAVFIEKSLDVQNTCLKENLSSHFKV